MFVLVLLSIAPVQSPRAAPLAGANPGTPEVKERTGRPTAPYSLPPVSALPREGSATRLVPPGTPGVVEVRVSSQDDSVPLPNPPIYGETPAGDVVEQPASGDPYFLGFAGGSHYPPVGELVDSELYASALTFYPDGRPTPETYAFVMFSARMTESRLAQLEALGCRLLGFHPHYTQKVALPATAIDAVAALPFVRWVGVPQQDQKVHPALLSPLASAPPNQPLDLWVSVFESDVGPNSVRRTLPGPVSTGPDVATVVGEPVELKDVWITNGWQHRALEAAGLEVIDFAERANAFRARGLPQGLELVTALDFVQFVELDLPASPTHDETMPMVNADDARNFFSGGTNLRTIAGIVDSGVESDHVDLDGFLGQGWDLSGSASGDPWDDACGHGSHVAGTLLGSGDGNDDHTGVAPGLGWSTTGEVYNVRIFATCAKQSVDEAAVIGLMKTPASSTPKPHVINNSWGGSGNSASPWIGSETECRLYDNNAYYDGQLNVFAAGNNGSAAGTIGVQASAKNVLTVGNVLDYGPFAALPGEIAFSSSRGPTGDDRWKPNVVAPGKWVTSVDAATPSGYTEKYGTSMAAPHVTGIASLLIDSNSAFTYVPERISAHLMATAHAKDNVPLSLPSNAHLDNYGTGRVDATRAIWGSGGSSSDWAFSLSSGGSTFGDFTVPSGATRLVAVMHYIEPAASSGASSALVNDWDFYLDQPPIDPAGNTGEYFIQQSAVDNTEIRILTDPLAGTWRWKVWPDSTSTSAFFGVSIYVQTTDATPALSPSLIKSDGFVKPLETVTMDYSLSTGSSGSISGAYLDSTATGAALLSSRTFLEDGVVTNLMDNQQSGWDVALGNVDPYFWRDAQWKLYWSTEGDKSFCVQTFADNASNTGISNCASVIVDSTPPGNVSNWVSTSHAYGVWSNDPTIDFAWTAAVDPVSGGTASGVDGYGHLVTNSAPAGVSTIKTLGNVTSYTTGTLATSANEYFLNLRTVDRSGNWANTIFNGDFWIDTIDPSTVTGLASSTHTIGVSSCDGTIKVSWSPASDAHSGIAGYSVDLDGSSVTTPPATPNFFGTSYSNLMQTAGNWYFHVRSVDNAGNASPTVHFGPFPFDPDPVSTYCTAKVNSQGCTPAIGTNNAPSYGGGAFEVVAKKVVNNKSGLLFWGFTSSATPFQGGTKCVANPVKRTSIQNSGGNAPPDDCSGTYSFNFSTGYMASKGIGAGDTIYCQYWSRDPSAPYTTGLTDAVRAIICP